MGTRHRGNREYGSQGRNGIQRGGHKGIKVAEGGHTGVRTQGGRGYIRKYRREENVAKNL